MNKYSTEKRKGEKMVEDLGFSPEQKDKPEQLGEFRFEVSETEAQMIIEVTDSVIAKIKALCQTKEKINIVTPAGGTADKFFGEFATQLNEQGIDLNKVNFYVGEDVYPIDRDNPASFSGRLQRNLVDKISIPEENVHLIDGNKSLEANIEMIRTLGAEGIDIFMAGLNESGAISALRSTLQWEGKSLDEVEIDLNKTSMLNEPDWVYKVYPDISQVLGPEVIAKIFPNESERPTNFLTFGYLPIIQSTNLMILGSGEKKRPAVSRIIPGLAAEGEIDGKTIGGNPDKIQSISTSEIINSRHLSTSFATKEKSTVIYLDKAAMPEVL